jgi:hypothetical protein
LFTKLNIAYSRQYQLNHPHTPTPSLVTLTQCPVILVVVIEVPVFAVSFFDTRELAQTKHYVCGKTGKTSLKV